MQRLNSLWQVLDAASAVTDIARRTQTYSFNVVPPITLYLQAENCEVRLMRWTEGRVEVTAQMQVHFGWRLVTDQDDSGVYVVAKRRPVVGNLASAVFTVVVPESTYLVFKLTSGQIKFEHVNGTIEISPQETNRTLMITQHV